MNFIVSVDEEWNIGYRGGLLQRIPDDMRQFRAKTVHRVVVMGRRTLESFPGGKPLPDRTNIVLTRRKDFRMEGAMICHSYPDLFDLLRSWPNEDIFIIGGGEIYNQLIPYCRKGFVTKLHKIYPADTRITDLDREDNWRIVGKDGPHPYKDEIFYTYLEYRNNRVRSMPKKE